MQAPSRRALVALVLAGTAVLAGCTPGSIPAPTGTPTATESSSAFTPGPTLEPDPEFPLTGLPGTATNPVIVAKIDNHPAARPQTGLGKADIVMEELVEGGLTRLIGVWQSTIPDDVGPIRSVRPMDPNIVPPFGGIIAFSGGQLKFVQEMLAQPVTAVYEGAKDQDLLFRTRDHVAPHNLHVKAKQLVARYPKLAAPSDSLFPHSATVGSSTASEWGVAATSVTARFSNSTTARFDWDAAQQVWLRTQDGKKATDETGKQLQAVNVIVMRVTERNNSSGAGATVPEVIVNGQSGEATFLADGKSVKGKWSKGAKSTDPFVFTDANGDAVELVPGNTWVEMVPTSGSVSIG